MADRELLARLDRITLLLVALLAVELLGSFGWNVPGVVTAVVVLALVSFVFFWGWSVVGLLFGERI